MNQETESSKPADNMELLKQEASACGPGCSCHAAGTSGQMRWVLGAIILVVAAALVTKAVMKSPDSSTQNANPAFAVPQSTGETAAPETVPVAPVPEDASPVAVATVAEPPTPEATAPAPAQQDVAVTATPAIVPTAPVAENTPVAETSAPVACKEIASFAELNELATDTKAVFVFMPAVGPTAGEPPTAQMQAAARTIEAQGGKVGIFILKVSSPDHEQLAKQMVVPGVIALVKGRGMKAVSGEITETKLVQSFVAASSAGGCGPASGGCGPATPGCQ